MQRLNQFVVLLIVSVIRCSSVAVESLLKAFSGCDVNFFQQTVPGKTYRFIKNKYILDCGNENKYVSFPAGLFSDQYIIDEPVVAHFLRTGGWMIAEEKSRQAKLWGIYFFALKTGINTEP